jgi:predicted GH43/DUF377 family glycosyl hydrolase
MLPCSQTPRVMWLVALLVIVGGVAAAMFLDATRSVVPLRDATRFRDDSIAAFGFIDRGGRSSEGRVFGALLTTDLSQIAGLDVLSDGHVRLLLHESGADPGVMDRAAAIDLARDAGVRWLVTGTVGDSASVYQADAHLIDLGTGSVVSTLPVVAEDIFAAVDSTSASIRWTLFPGRFGDAIDRPVQEVTSSSLAAYRAYVNGLDSRRAGDRRGAAVAFERAAALDSTFAMAHYSLALAVPEHQQEPHLAAALRWLHRATPGEQAAILNLHAAQTWPGDDGGGPPYQRRNRTSSCTIFAKFSDNPVVTLGNDLDSGHAEYPGVVAVGDSLWMFYAAFGQAGRWSIALATSIDGRSWQKRGEVLAPDPSATAWDGGSVAFPCVLHDPDARNGERFRMYYAGKRSCRYAGIGLATSPNGLDWRRRGRVVTLGDAGAWDSHEIVDPAVVKNREGYRLYYCGSGREGTGYAIGLAESRDGVSWTKRGQEPLYVLDGRSRLYTIDVLATGDGYLLFESSSDPEGFAHVFALHSRDGIHFDPAARRRVLSPSRDGSWDHVMVYGMETLMWRGRLCMWFNGIYRRMVTPGGQVGFASTDPDSLRAYLVSMR